MAAGMLAAGAAGPGQMAQQHSSAQAGEGGEKASCKS